MAGGPNTFWTNTEHRPGPVGCTLAVQEHNGLPPLTVLQGSCTKGMTAPFWLSITVSRHIEVGVYDSPGRISTALGAERLRDCPVALFTHKVLTVPGTTSETAH